MPRKMIGVLMLAGITLSGAVGGGVMRAGSRMPRERTFASRALQLHPMPETAAARPAVGRHADASHDVFALAGD